MHISRFILNVLNFYLTTSKLLAVAMEGVKIKLYLCLFTFMNLIIIPEMVEENLGYHLSQSCSFYATQINWAVLFTCLCKDKCQR